MEEKLVPGQDYRVLSLHPQWAWAVMFGGKAVEYRTWATSYRGRILIHASSKRVPESQRDAVRGELAREFRLPLARVPAEFEASAILGSVELVDCVEQGPGNVDWILRDVRPLATPLRGIHGKLKLWHWTPAPVQGRRISGAPSSKLPATPTPATKKSEPAAMETDRPTSAEDLDANTVMASFRSVATLEGMPERDFLRDASRKLGFARMGMRVEAALKAQLRTAMKRKLIQREGKNLRAATRSLRDYDTDTLVGIVGSLLRRGQAVERRELSVALLQNLGFGTPDNTNAQEAAPALEAAVSKRILVADGTKLRRVG